MTDKQQVVVHSFTMGDVEDPEIYAAMPINQWEESEEGKWVKENAIGDIFFHIVPDNTTWGSRVIIKATLGGPALTYWTLKYGFQGKHHR